MQTGIRLEVLVKNTAQNEEVIGRLAIIFPGFHVEEKGIWIKDANEEKEDWLLYTFSVPDPKISYLDPVQVLASLTQAVHNSKKYMEGSVYRQLRVDVGDLPLIVEDHIVRPKDRATNNIKEVDEGISMELGEKSHFLDGPVDHDGDYRVITGADENASNGTLISEYYKNQAALDSSDLARDGSNKLLLESRQEDIKEELRRRGSPLTSGE